MSYRPAGRRAVDIAADVEAAIAAGRAQGGTLLPTVRALAAELGVAAGTVATAYRLLAERGVVDTNRRAGTRIRTRPAPVRDRGDLGIPTGLIDLASGNPDATLLADPVAALATIALDREERGAPALTYGAPAVLPALGAWAEARFRADGVELGAVTVAGGALDAVERGLQTHLRPGLRVAVEDPGYPGMLDLIAALELVADPVPVDDEGMRPDGLRRCLGRGAQAVVITPRAQNPTGAALSEARVDALGEVLADAPAVLVIEDDHAGPVAGSAPRSVVGGPRSSPGRRALVVRSCSKALGPDLRVALVSGDRATVEAIDRRRAVGTGWVSHVLQSLALVMLTNPDSDRWLAGVADLYAGRRLALIRELERLGIASTGRSGLNVWVPVPDEATVLAGMAARGWAVAAGSRFRIASPPGIRVTTAALEVVDAPEVAADLAASMGTAGRTRSG